MKADAEFNGTYSELRSDESIKVFVRVRPPDANLQTDFDNTLLLDVSPPDTIIFNGQQDGKTFTYDNVAGIDATQVSTSYVCTLGSYDRVLDGCL